MRWGILPNMETCNKLVRDKIPEILDEKGVSYEKIILKGKKIER